MKRFCIFVLVLLVTPLSGQVKGYVEDFNDNVLTGWEMPDPDTFYLEEAGGILKISYNRTASSWEWDNFNYIPLQNIDVTENPMISLKVKSGVGTELVLKTIFLDNTNDWLTALLPSDDKWHTVLFNVADTVSGTINRIYFYLDGGTTVPKSGEVYFNDLRFGDSVIVQIDLADLETAIEDAQNLVLYLEEGSGEGLVPAGSRATLESAIDQAVIFLNRDHSGDTQQSVDAAIEALYDACVDFETSATVANIQITDPLATRETKYLLDNILLGAENGLMFGMHDVTGYGVGWSGDDDRSDVKDVCGDYPAVYSWDLNTVTQNQSGSRLKYRMTSAYERGGINTMCWHQYDPMDRGFYAENVNNERIVSTILPGGIHHDIYKNDLRSAARFFKSLRGSNGESIPVIFRPYHEHDGDWFWWGTAHCTRQEFIDIWQFTAVYLRDSLKVHNLLYAFSPNQFETREEYLDRYPGDEYIDIIGMDYYFPEIVYSMHQAIFLRKLQVVALLGIEKAKISAVTEVGQEALTTPDWFTRVLLEPLKMDSLATRIAYAAVWRNASTTHHYAPYPGHSSAPDFVLFYRDGYTLFESDLPDMYVLASEDTSAPVFTRVPESPFVATSTSITVNIETNERADLRYSVEDTDYDSMESEFREGQGTRFHSNMWAGTQGLSCTYYVKARDVYGNTTASQMISFTVDTMQAPVVWYDLSYPDKGWKSGTGPLGYGNTGDATPLSTVHTGYFRMHFGLTEAQEALGLLVKCHDGAIAYINGYEIGRINMPESGIEYETNALSADKHSRIFVFDSGALSRLRIGDNAVTVEVHVSDTQTPDLSFDGQLFNASGILVPLKSDWLYWDNGYQPEDKTVGEVTGITDFSYQTGHDEFFLFPVYPNPFNHETTLRFTIPRTTRVRIEVYNTSGQTIETLVARVMEPGLQSVLWNAPGKVSGVYLFRIQAADYSDVRKCLLLK